MDHAIILTDVNGSIGLGRYAGPYRLATELENIGWSIDVIDFIMSFSIDELKEIISCKIQKNTKWIGFSSTFLLPPDFDPFANRIKIRESAEISSSIGFQIDEAQNLINFIKAKNIKVLVGGSKLKYDLKGVEWFKGTGEEYFNKNFNYSNAKINWHKKHLIFENEHLPLEIARGCIFKCSFCSYNLNGKKLWEFCKHPEIIKEELLHNFDNFGTTGYMFSDDTYNDSPEKIKKLLDVYKTLPFKLEFSAYARLDMIISKPHTLPILIESGLKSVFFGIETFNHESGKSIGKGMHPDKIKKGLEDIKKEYPELLISAGFIAGLPFETENSLNETITWLKHSKLDSYSFQVLSLGKNSDIGKNYQKYGYTIDKNGNWFNKNLTYKQAINIVSKTNKGSIYGFTFYNRLRNLDYSPEEIVYLKEKNKKEITFRKKKNIYYIKDNYNLFINTVLLQ